MPAIVSLDIETTGLDPKSDSVIEIGAVKFNENRVLDEFSTLINPRKPINSFITNLTGITNAMVMNAPLLADVYPELETFIGDHPILGQNIGFDISFFQRYGGFKQNPLIDTYEMAAVLLPGAPRYGLGSLSYQLGVVLSDAHRAINDARATMGVYNKLFEKLGQLPIDLIAELVKQSQGLGMGGGIALPLGSAGSHTAGHPAQTRGRPGRRAVFRVRQTRSHKTASAGRGASTDQC